MIEVWNVFDAAYLSRNKPDLLLKLFRAINFRQSKDAIYRDLE